MILRGTRAARGRQMGLSIVWPRLLWCRSTKSARHRGHKCSANSISSAKSADSILRDSHQMLPGLEEQGDDHCGSEPSRCVQSWQGTF